MKLRTLLILNTMSGALFGIALLIFPGSTLSMYGVTLTAPGIIVTRLLGAAYFGFAVLSWFAREVTDPAARRAVVSGFFASYLPHFIVALFGQLNGITNALGWSIVFITLFFTVGFGYFQIVRAPKD